MIMRNQDTKGIHMEKIKNFCSRESGYKNNNKKRRRRKEQDRTEQNNQNSSSSSSSTASSSNPMCDSADASFEWV
jgi:hypothetical protein